MMQTQLEDQRTQHEEILVPKFARPLTEVMEYLITGDETPQFREGTIIKNRSTLKTMPWSQFWTDFNDSATNKTEIFSFFRLLKQKYFFISATVHFRYISQSMSIWIHKKWALTPQQKRGKQNCYTRSKSTLGELIHDPK